ncbi:MAG TPA: heme-binding protein [Beijerinckiaceae bacterium]|jgi:uncharacterized protein GlcG (DUF336 family)|nr:heme-binding protein [Beijerinckiaceae bacterium]
MSIDLKMANYIINKAFDLALERKLAALTVCILDSGGHLVSAQRQDGSSIMRFEIAQGKAYAALALGRSTRFMQETLAVQRPGFVEALSVAANGKFIPVAGGLIIRNSTGAVLGAIGVTGDSADNDETIGVDAVIAAGLSAGRD